MFFVSSCCLWQLIMIDNWMGDSFYRCHHSCRACDGASHFNCLSCHKNSTLVNGTCHFCLEGHFMNRDTKICEACHSSCSSCSGPLASDCLTCKGGLFMDNSHCVPCCASSTSFTSTLQPEFTDCCQCVSPNGPCTSFLAIDKTRSIQVLRETPLGGTQPAASSLYRLLSQAATFIILLAIIACVAFIAIRRHLKGYRRKRLASYNIDYQKLNVNYSSQKNNRLEAVDRENEDDEEEDDDEERILFNKT